MNSQDHDLEQSLFFIIKRTSKAFREKLNQNFTKAGYDVTSEQWRILRCLWQKDGQRQQDLADVVNKDKTCITRIIDSMEKRDLVVRIPDRLDRRQNLIYLTNKGKKLQEELIKIFDNTSLDAQRDIDPEHLAVFRKILEKIYHNLTNS
ncbi:MAG: MarR family winged helix-turn-helix transcriptional regulator [bacterium]